MDLKRTESTLKNLEENVVKVGEISEAIKEFKTLVDQAEKVYSELKISNSDLALRISDIEKNLTRSIDDIEKNLTRSIDEQSKELKKIEKAQKATLSIIVVPMLLVLISFLAGS